ncbi:glycosyltransferase family 9 protein [Flaviaesturariibacter amylovorans]|uniref:Glycosyltransferase family 9 protein n=1 Tax=Flaviaesturariibacter amylovorans TaxID=1084520 RepID=A0ABP8GK95_9BACT
MKVLFIRFGAIGNLVLTTPVLRCFRKKFPDAELYYVLLKEHRAVLEPNPYLSRLYFYEQGNAFATSLRDAGFDHVVDLQHDEASRLLTGAIGVEPLRVPARNWQHRLFTSLRWNLLPREHQVDRNFAAVAPFGVANDGEGLDFFIPREAEVPMRDIPTSHQLGYLALVIGASKYTKRLPVAHLKALCARIGHPIILLGGPEEAARGEEIRSVDPIKIYNACGKFSLHESADLLRRAKLVITHDTGLMHIAAALKKPILSVWGSTVPAQGMSPYYGTRVLERNPAPSVESGVKLWCRPCTRTGRDRCPLGHFKCMNRQDMEQLARMAEERLWKKE